MNNSSTPWVVNMYDGADDIVIGTVNAGTDKFIPGASALTVFTDIKQAASTTATGVSELATQTEVNGNTGGDRVVTSDVLNTWSGSWTASGSDVYRAAGNVGIGVVSPTSKLHLPLENDAVTPTLAFGDGDTGFYEQVDDIISVSLAGVKQFHFNGNLIGGALTDSPAFINEAASATNPNLIPSQSDLDTGVGWVSADILALIAGGSEIARLSSTGVLIAPGYQLEIDKLAQDSALINFKATIDADATSAISSLTTSGSTTHHIQVSINGTAFWIAGSTTDPT
jgi:hypothetical protein